jgi:thioredoxin reductase (NADPH)
MKQNYDVIIIGAGISGIASAIYLKRYNLNVLVIEKEYPGGQLNKISKIENYPGFQEISGMDLAMNLYNQLKYLEIPIYFSNVLNISIKNNKKIVETTNEIFESSYLVLATGRKPRKLGLEEEETLLGKGISYCATCDGPLFKEKEVCVVGGGDSAIQEALYLSELCKKVMIIHRRDHFTTTPDKIKRVENKDNIEVCYNSVINTLNTKNDILESIIFTQNGEKKIKKVSGLFIYIGMEPNNEVFKNLNIVNENGYVDVNNKFETTIKGIYACGDIISKEVYQLTTATGEATIVARNLHLDCMNSQ